MSKIDRRRNAERIAELRHELAELTAIVAGQGGQQAALSSLLTDAAGHIRDLAGLVQHSAEVMAGATQLIESQAAEITELHRMVADLAGGKP